MAWFLLLFIWLVLTLVYFCCHSPEDTPFRRVGGFRRVRSGEWQPRSPASGCHEIYNSLATGSPVYGSERELPYCSTRPFGLRRPRFSGWLRSFRRIGMLDLCECHRNCAGLGRWTAYWMLDLCECLRDWPPDWVLHVSAEM